jgi:hypothetical protein
MKIKWVLHLGVYALLLAACTRNISAPTAVATEKLFLTRTPVPTDSIKMELNACVATDEAIRIREGPDTDYEVIGGLAPGACITILERNADSSWVYIETADNFTGWVAAWLLTVEGDLSQVSVQSDGSFSAATEIAQSVQLCTNIANRLGSAVTCKIEPAYCIYLPDVDGSPTFCTDKPYPNHFFQFVVYDEDWSEYSGLCLIVSGSLESYYNGQEGLLQIVGHDRSQVSTCQ